MNRANIALAAEKKIREYIRETPLDYSPFLSKLCGCAVYLKLESEQLTGSFKIRGALHKLLSLTAGQKKKGIITASTGNHALAVAYGLQKFNIKGSIYLPENAAKSKIAALGYYKASLKFYGTDAVATEMRARNEAKKNGLVFISPYNDSEIIAGQGTVGVEILRQLPSVSAIFAPVGGGGLIAGIADYAKKCRGEIKIIGCLPKASPVMYESVKAEKIIDMESQETLSDGTAGGIEPDSITFGICKNLVDNWLLASEAEIKSAVRLIIEHSHKIIEGSAALPVAALLKNKEKFVGQNVVLVISGSNIGIEKLKEIIS